MLVLLFLYVVLFHVLFFFKQKTAYDMRISDWSSDVCSSDLWENLKIIPAHPEIPTGKGCVVALVLKGHQLADDLTLVRRFALLHREGHGGIGLDRSNAIKK